MTLPYLTTSVWLLALCQRLWCRGLARRTMPSKPSPVISEPVSVGIQSTLSEEEEGGGGGGGRRVKEGVVQGGFVGGKLGKHCLSLDKPRHACPAVSREDLIHSYIPTAGPAMPYQRSEHSGSSLHGLNRKYSDVCCGYGHVRNWCLAWMQKPRSRLSTLTSYSRHPSLTGNQAHPHSRWTKG